MDQKSFDKLLEVLKEDYKTPNSIESENTIELQAKNIFEKFKMFGLPENVLVKLKYENQQLYIRLEPSLLFKVLLVIFFLIFFICCFYNVVIIIPFLLFPIGISIMYYMNEKEHYKYILTEIYKIKHP